MRYATLFLLLATVAWADLARAQTGIVTTRHNLSVSGPGEIKALTETRICVFCHTPHNAAPSTPLWNKALEPVNYTLYQSSTLSVSPTQPSGPSRLCLSCHDGTIALGQVLTPSAGIGTTMEISPARRSYLGIDISNDHPVSFSYHDALPNAELSPVPPPDLLFYGAGNIHCSTCHDPHDDTYGKFLVADNRYSALCRKCHIKTGWSQSIHSQSINGWSNAGVDPWPHTAWETVAENGCENCHTPHNAGGAKRLLNYQAEEQNCYPCHNGNVALPNIELQFQKTSAHQVAASTIGLTANAHDPAEQPALLSSHVECVDCHNPHAVTGQTADAPYASGSLNLVSGVDSVGAGVPSVTYEYEICYKCHAESSQVFPVVNRVINENNTRLEFDTFNPSYHPVAGIGKNPDVPSLPSTYEPQLTASSIIYCTDCHDNDKSPKVGGTGPRGPHGSIYAPILRERYETADNTPELYEHYALCYRCHDRTSLLNDASFQKNLATGRGGHSLHLAGNIPCSACHDPHGVKDNGLSGDHTHLINFDVLIATPASGQTAPLFTDKGSRAGSCTLVCHGRAHSDANSTYP